MSRNQGNNLVLLEAVLNAPGATDQEIGSIVGLSRVQVSRRRNTPEFKKLLNQHIQDSLKPLLLARTKAVRRICEAIDSRDEKIALKAAQLVLDLSPTESLAKEEKGSSWEAIRASLERLKLGKKNHAERAENFEKFGRQMTNEELAALNARKAV